MDEGQPVSLRSELRLRKSLAERLASSQPEWWRKLDGVLSLGRSRKDDYGSVVLETRPAADWTSTANADATELFVWLVSDTLRKPAVAVALSVMPPTISGLRSRAVTVGKGEALVKGEELSR